MEGVVVSAEVPPHPDLGPRHQRVVLLLLQHDRRRALPSSVPAALQLGGIWRILYYTSMIFNSCQRKEEISTLPPPVVDGGDGGAWLGAAAQHHLQHEAG